MTLEKKYLEEVEKVLKDPICNIEGIEKITEITPKLRLEEDLGLDSLDRCKFLILLEEKMGITIPEKNNSKFKTVGDYVNYLKRYNPKTY